jgi:manganese/zinc/iron transport system permease protein
MKWKDKVLSIKDKGVQSVSRWRRDECIGGFESGTMPSGAGARPYFILSPLSFSLPLYPSSFILLASPSSDLWRALSLADYNTRVVLVGTLLLGAACGLVGTFLLLRRRALLGDAIAHATLPGVVIAFLLAVMMGGSGRELPVLLLGAAVCGVLGTLTVVGMRHATRIKDDAALAIVLGVFFAFGTVLLGIATRIPGANSSGLSNFIYGKAASLLLSDVLLIGSVAVAVLVVCVLFFKELSLLCFDQGFARADGWPTALLDIALMMLAVVVCVIGMQAVGLILVVALLVIPPAAARFWTNNVRAMAGIATGIGAASAVIGSLFSAIWPQTPSGPLIVLVAAALFALSLVFGRRRGVAWQWIAHARLSRRVARQHLLRALYEAEESAEPATTDALLQARSWRRSVLERELKKSVAEGLIALTADNTWKLTHRGHAEAARVVRNHRLWELYLIAHADVAPGRVDRDADMVEHVLDAAMIERLELLGLAEGTTLPPSPHVSSGEVRVP